ncbi:MAG: hypothetical protein ACE5GB_09480 [Acidimicrobiales bacterium]
MPRARRIERTILALAFAAAAGYVFTHRTVDPVTTRVAVAEVTLGGDSARSVEQVVYVQDVTRLGDIVLSAGRPVDEPVEDVLARAWRLVDEVWPDSMRSDLVQVSVVEGERRGLVGVVHRSATRSGWILSVDAADFDEPDLMRATIVHELAHVVTLGPDVFTFGPGGCSGFEMPLGCAGPGSVLARFGRRFWPEGAATVTGESAFVNSYAASAVHEDLAETFTAWVFDWTIEPGTVAEAKVGLLADDAEMTAVREQLRSRMLERWSRTA